MKFDEDSEFLVSAFLSCSIKIRHTICAIKVTIFWRLKIPDLGLISLTMLTHVSGACYYLSGWLQSSQAAFILNYLRFIQPLTLLNYHMAFLSVYIRDGCET